MDFKQRNNDQNLLFDFSKACLANSQLNNASLLISGSQGFFGKNLSFFLKESVRRGLVFPKEIVQISRQIDSQKEELIHDVRFVSLSNQYFLNNPFDVDFLIHLASPSNITKFSTQYEVVEPNTTFQESLLRHVTRHAIYFSSSEIYRINDAFQRNLLTKESEQEPRNWYPIAKLSGEAVCETWGSEVSDRLASVIRLFHTYGPNLDKNDGRSFADFLWQASVGKEIVLKSDGSHKRTFLYVGDAITALFKILNRDDRAYRVFDIGSQNELTILQFAQTVSEISGVPLRFNFDESFPHSKDLRLYPNLGELQSLGWHEKIDLFSGVKVTLKNMQSKLA